MNNAGCAGHDGVLFSVNLMFDYFVTCDSTEAARKSTTEKAVTVVSWLCIQLPDTANISNFRLDC